MFGKYCGDWFLNGWFYLLAKQTDKDLKLMYEDGDAYIRLIDGKMVNHLSIGLVF